MSAIRYFYYWKIKNEIVVQDMEGGTKCQMHKHNAEDFEEWKKQAEPENLINTEELRKK